MADKLWFCDAEWVGGQTFKCSVSAPSALAAIERFVEYASALLERFGDPRSLKVESAAGSPEDERP